MSSTGCECSDLDLLVLLSMVPYRTTITSFVRLIFSSLVCVGTIYLFYSFLFLWFLKQLNLFQELFPFQGWWVVPVKVAFDQTIWAAIWNSIYFTVLGFLRLESPINIFSELKATFWPMLTVRNLVSFSFFFVEK